MQLCQIQENGHLIRSNSIRHPSSGKHQISNSYLTHSIPVGNNRTLPNTSHFITPFCIGTASTKNSMSKSLIQRSQNQDYESFAQQIKQKLWRISKTLSEHEAKINRLQDKKQNGQVLGDHTILDSLITSQKHSFSELSNRVFQDRILCQIQKLRQQLNSPLKNSLSSQSTKHLLILQQSVMNVESKLTQKVKQLREKTYNQLKTISQSFKKQLQCQIFKVNGINQNAFNKIQKDVLQLQRRIDILYNDKTIRSGKQKYFGQFQTIKYKQIVQKHKQQIVLNEGVYYLDKDGYLLDKQGFYLVDDNNKWVQLEITQIMMLKNHGILQ